MADEENPLGGGPFGVGPFGPLVGAAVAAATVFNMVVVTTSTPVTRTLFYQAKIAPPPQPPAPAAATAESFSVTTGRASSKSLFYQARIGPPPTTPTVDNTGTFATWYVPLSRPPARPPSKAALYTPFVATPAPQVSLAWQQPFRRAVQAPQPIHTQPSFNYPGDVVVSNLTTTLEWMRPFDQAAPHAWPTKQVLPFVPKEAVLENTVTPDKWLQAFRGPPRYTPAPQGGSPFIPKEAVLENTVTPDKWMVRFQGAVPVPPVHHTQPFLGYPYQAASNLTTTLEWMPAWRAPPSYTPIKVQTPPFVPKADVIDQVTPDKWLQAFRGPPRAVPAQAGGSPFVPKEAVLDNTVTPDKWLVRFAKAVPTPKPVPTQPEYRYPYESLAIVVPYEQWWHQPLSRAAARPPVHAKPYQPFVPKEAVAENTQTPDKWLQRWQAPPAYRPIKVQTPPFVPKAAVVDVVTPDKWLLGFQKAVPRRPVTHTQPPFVYVPPAVVTLTTTLEWQQPLSVAVRTPRARPTQPTLYLPEVVVTADVATAESFSVTWAYPVRRSLLYQAKIAPPYAPIVAPTPTPGPLEWLQAWKGPPRYQPAGRHTQPFIGRPQAAFPDADIGGPADEPERVVCILPHSRVAVVPEVLRVATVPVDLRVATVPELSRTVEVLFSDRDEDSNESTTLPCAAPIVMPEPEDHAFQVDTFQVGDTFQ